ncbi:MAG: hypothetical protein AAFQ80_21985 [Cyanobacteria bacterium J06621_8]
MCLKSREEEEALKASGHGRETVGWLAIETGSGNWDGFDYTVGSTANEIDESWDTVLFGQTFDEVLNFLASLSSFAGGILRG